MMGFWETFRLALGILAANKGRTALTSLGIIIGIGGVVAMVAAGDGAHHKLDERLESAGKNLVIVRPGSRTNMGLVAEFRPLTRDDVEAIRKEVGPLLVGAVPWQAAAITASTRTRRSPTTAIGTWPEFRQVGGWQVVHGRLFDESEVHGAALVCLLGQTIREKLFPHRDNPVGERVQIGRVPMQVIGVLGRKGSTPLGADQDDQVFVPLSTLQQKMVGRESISMILATARSGTVVKSAAEEIVHVLRRQHHLGPAAANDFDVSSVKELSQFAVTLTSTLQTLVAIIAGIALIVGGIGILNIMLVSVTERTREIGIRMAVGATPAGILFQFLMEAVVLSLLGGVAGILLGVVVAVGLGRVAGWPVLISPGIVLLAFFVTAVVGVLFGYYPAWKASRLDPIDALNHE